MSRSQRTSVRLAVTIDLQGHGGTENQGGPLTSEQGMNYKQFQETLCSSKQGRSSLKGSATNNSQYVENRCFSMLRNVDTSTRRVSTVKRIYGTQAPFGENMRPASQSASQAASCKGNFPRASDSVGFLASLF